MKKLTDHSTEITPNLGKPPKGVVFKRVTAEELGPEFFSNAPKIPVVFKETTHEDFERIIAELKNEPRKV